MPFPNVYHHAHHSHNNLSIGQWTFTIGLHDTLYPALTSTVRPIHWSTSSCVINHKGGYCHVISVIVHVDPGIIVWSEGRRPKDEVCIISCLTTFNLRLGVFVCVPFKYPDCRPKDEVCAFLIISQLHVKMLEQLQYMMSLHPGSWNQRLVRNYGKLRNGII
jgi:hypothetical protein